MHPAIPMWVLYVFAGIFGAILGSFANVCIIRIPSGRSIIWPPSECVRCRHRLKAWENIPIISYAMLGGRCSKCGGGISILYPSVEALCVALSVFAWWYFKDPRYYFVYLCLLIVPLVIISFIDIRQLIIPDAISLPGIAIGIGVHTFLESHGMYLEALIDSVVGAVAGAAFLFIIAFAYEKLKKHEGLGGGDIKLIAMLGAFFGWRAVFLILLMSSVLGSLAGIIMILAMKKGTKHPIPYGPFLALAGLINLFYGEDIVFWYLSLFK